MNIAGILRFFEDLRLTRFFFQKSNYLNYHKYIYLIIFTPKYSKYTYI